MDEGGVILLVQELSRNARNAAAIVRNSPQMQRDAALRAAAAEVRKNITQLCTISAREVDDAQRAGATPAFIDRLVLTPQRIEAAAAGIEAVAALPDPLGRVLEVRQRPNGLRIEKVSVAIGVLGMICESRPAVAADAGALAIKSGNALLLRSGSESFESAGVFLQALRAGLRAAGLSEGAVSDLGTSDRAAVGELLRGAGCCVDLIIPRGGASLVRRVLDEARVPVLAHAAGLCHTYIDAQADMAQAHAVVMNAKLRRTGVCGATETLLIHRDRLLESVPLLRALHAAGCALRGDDAVRACAADIVVPAAPEDADTEYLDAILSVYAVDSLAQAIAHVNRHGSGHTDAILTRDADAAAQFMTQVDSAIVMHNASTQFADGGEFGMGGEIGIATGRLHARGPVGLDGLTTYQWRVHGAGHVRPA